jgi:hypothetical protein
MADANEASASVPANQDRINQLHYILCHRAETVLGSIGWLTGLAIAEKVRSQDAIAQSMAAKVANLTLPVMKV